MTVEKLRNFEPLFGSWTIDGKISQGRNSKLYRVSRRTETGIEYLAVKTIRFPKDETEFQKVMSTGAYRSEDDYLEQLEARLRLNMKKMMSLRNSKHIVRFDDYMVIKEIHCFYVVILTELLMPLSEYFSQNKIDSKEIAKLGSHISSALADIRSAEIIHKEVKPENIYVSKNGTYKLGDFGIDADAETGDTSAFSNYYPPEIANGSQISTSSDVYSLGMVLYKFMNRNRLPFLPPFPQNITPEDRQRAYEKRISGEPLPKPELSDPTFTKIILKAVEFSPERRYKSPEFLQNDLNRYLSGMTLKSVNSAPTHSLPETKVVTAQDREKNEFQKAFEDDEADETTGNKKKLYGIIGAVAAVLVCIAVLVSFLSGRDDEPLMAETVTTRPLITKATEKETTTEVPTTEETTLPETTTEAETTTEETTTEVETTTEAETTTEVVTTEAAVTTDAIVTTGAQSDTTVYDDSSEEVILYRDTGNVIGELDSEGREYNALSGLKAKCETRGDQLSRVIISANSFGTNPYKNSDAFICQVSDGTVILKEAVSYTCSYDDDEPDGDIEIIINFLGDIYFDDTTDFYIVLEEGAISSDDYTSLATQIKL